MISNLHGSADRFKGLLGFLWHLTNWIAFDRWTFVGMLAVIGLLLANVRIRRWSRGPTPSKKVRLWRRLTWDIIGVLAGVSLASVLIAVSVFFHAADLRWIPPRYRQGLKIGTYKLPSGSHIPFIGGTVTAITNVVNGAMVSFSGHLNSALHPLLMVPAFLLGIWNAAQVCVEFIVLAGASGIVAIVMLSIKLVVMLIRILIRLVNAEKKSRELERRMDLAGVPALPAPRVQPVRRRGDRRPQPRPRHQE